MTRQPKTRDELVDALTVEQFGPLTPEYHNDRVPVVESATDQVIRRYELALAVDDVVAGSTKQTCDPRTP